VTELRAYRSEISSVPMVAAVKSLVALRTQQPAWRRILPPLMELSGSDQNKIAAVAGRLGFAEQR
jgi:hypothetical protein